jgi:hypothetical protein
MIDRPARLKAIDFLQRALVGDVINWDFDDKWPKSEDQALQPIAEYLWLFYDDNCKYLLNFRKQKPDVVALVERCIAFLSSDFEYHWPEQNFVGRGVIGSLFQKKTDKDDVDKFVSSGDIEVWPFIKKQDLDRVQLALTCKNDKAIP